MKSVIGKYSEVAKKVNFSIKDMGAPVEHKSKLYEVTFILKEGKLELILEFSTWKKLGYILG